MVTVSVRNVHPTDVEKHGHGSRDFVNLCAVRNTPAMVRSNIRRGEIIASCQVATGAIALAVGLAFSVSACSPALDWRETRLQGPGLLALFPCRPVAQSRQIELAGA